MVRCTKPVTDKPRVSYIVSLYSLKFIWNCNEYISL